MAWLWIALGGALGSLSRYGVVTAMQRSFPSAFPQGTLLVNVLGSLLIGVFMAWFLRQEAPREEWRWLAVVGFLGAFTTFSAFSWDTWRLLDEGRLVLAAGNVLGSVLLCLLATGVGVWLQRQF
ncbi:MAG: fluoride efflux transporter CrcB [Moraxellaceae bacterium]|nr:fluoride efflux transporter CrcB [Moraxellaceae bacterium]